MSMDSHLVELKRRHRVLEDQIAAAVLHPGMDGLDLARLKREKLFLKDRIKRLSTDQSLH